MAIAILSDIHANIEALDAVLRDRDYLNKRGRGIDRTYCLGDIVDYGANPREAIERVRRECDVVITGNHDMSATGKSFESHNYRGVAICFEPLTSDTIIWTRERLLEIPVESDRLRDFQDVRKYLESLPLIHKEGDMTFVHAAPLEGFYPTFYFERERILDFARYADVDFDTLIGDIFSGFDRLCFVGHTHVPLVTRRESDMVLMEYVNGSTFFTPSELGDKAVVNVGSVGQPRDMDKRACYVIVDDEKIEFRRVEYDREETMRKIAEVPALSGYLYHYT